MRQGHRACIVSDTEGRSESSLTDRFQTSRSTHHRFGFPLVAASSLASPHTVGGGRRAMVSVRRQGLLGRQYFESESLGVEPEHEGLSGFHRTLLAWS